MHWLCCNHCIIESLKIPTQYFQDLSSPFFCLWNRDDLFDTQISSFYYFTTCTFFYDPCPTLYFKAVLCLCLANLRKLTGEIALKKCTKQNVVFLFWCNIKTRLKITFSADREYARPGVPSFHEYNMCVFFCIHHSYNKKVGHQWLENTNTCDLVSSISVRKIHFIVVHLSSWILAKLLLRLLLDSSCQKKVSFHFIQTSKVNQTEFSDMVDQREQQFMCSKCYFVASTNSELQMHEMSCN